MDLSENGSGEKLFLYIKPSQKMSVHTTLVYSSNNDISQHLNLNLLSSSSLFDFSAMTVQNGVKWIFFGVITFLLISSVLPERILFLLPLSTKSHKILIEPLINGMARKGHEVTVLTNEKTENVPNSVTQLLPITSTEFLADYPDPFENKRRGGGATFPIQFIVEGCHKVIQNKTFQSILMEAEGLTQFDLIVMDGFLSNCLDGFVHASKVPFIIVTSMPAPSYVSERAGNFLPPSIIPVLSFRGYNQPDGGMNFGERLKNFVHFLLARIYMNFLVLPKLEQVYRDYLGNDYPGIKEIEEGASMIFMNSHFSMNLPRPLLPAVVEIGGMHCREPKPLKSDVEKFVSKSASPDGFIYFSVGSLIDLNNAPEEFIQGLFSTFSKLKQRVLIKWKGAQGINKTRDVPENVWIDDWFSQQDILGHKNIRLFISHGGLLSMQEAVYHAVPVLGIPFGVDQDTNVHNAVLQGFALKLEIDEVNEKLLHDSITQILEDSRFYKNAKRISNVFRQRPVPPLDTALFWTEYVMTIMHKGNNTFIQSPSRTMSIFQYYSTDILIFFLLLLIIMILVAKNTLKIVYQLFISKDKKLKPAEENNGIKSKRN
ncbi:unnamed protein product [Orchesella dallaii]|uniref:UDP-glycosyltransferases domain-containing protein n=1 Tax=Orchesella dallaii TaxID=48710 RepID=A0ABP1Q0B6_9HEXA